MAKPEVTCTYSFCCFFFFFFFFFFLQNKVSTLIFIDILWLFFFLLALVGYGMIIANSYPTRAHGIIVN